MAGGNAGEFGHRQGLVCESEWLLCVAGMAPERILGLADGSLVLIEPAVPEPLFTPKDGRGVDRREQGCRRASRGPARRLGFLGLRSTDATDVLVE